MQRHSNLSIDKSFREPPSASSPAAPNSENEVVSYIHIKYMYSSGIHALIEHPEHSELQRC